MTEPASSSLRFTCPHCGGSVKVPRAQAGSECLCPKCGRPIRAPSPDQAAGSSGAASVSGGPRGSPPLSTPSSPSPSPTSSDDSGFRLSDPVETPPYAPLSVGEAEPLGDRGAPSPSSESSPPSRPAPPTEEIRVVCRVCGSRIDAPANQAGQLVTCPDCHTQNVVQARPARQAQRPSVPPEKGEPLKVRPLDSPPDQPARAESEAIFGFACQLCGTRLYAAPSQIGKKLVCSDCNTVNRVPAPPPPPSEPSPAIAGDATFRLTDPVERPKYEPITPEVTKEMIAAAERPPSPGSGAPSPTPPPPPAPPRTGPPPTVGDDAMAKAEAEYDEKKRRIVDLPDRPLWTGVLKFFKYPSTLARWLAVSIGLTLVIVLGDAAMALSENGAMGGFLSAACCAAVALLSPATAALGAACFLAITVDSSNGYDEIVTWPDLDFLNWLPNCFYLLNSLFASALPALPLFWLFQAFGAPAWLTGLILAAASFFLFPIALLSMLETGSCMTPISGPVWKSLSEGKRYWRLFYGESAALVVAALLGVTLLSLGGRPALPLGAAWMTAACMLYFRLLGRLAWACQAPAESEVESES